MNNKKTMIFGGVMLAAILGLVGTLAIQPAVASDDDGGGWFGGKHQDKGGFSALVAEECGSCHVPYPARLLPARSWDKMMTELDNHFGDNAELEPDVQAEITAYLVANSADRSGKKKWLRGVGKNDTPQRMTELSYFKKEHREVPKRTWGLNPELTLSQCDSCHTKAANNSYRERDIVIPGIGKFED